MGVTTKNELLALGLVLFALVPFPLGVFYFNQNMFMRPGEIQVVVEQWKFIPDEVTVKKGDLVRLLIRSEDVVHGLRIVGYDIDVVVKPGDPVRVEFVANKAGVYAYTCSVACGAEHSVMSGKFIVEETSPPGDLRVLAKDAKGDALVGAAVTISGPITANGTTDANGQYTFRNVMIGNYSIRVLSSGYKSNMTSGAVSSGQTTTVSVALTPAVVKEFHIEAWTPENGNFKVKESPDGRTITVNQGDVVRLVVTPMDTAHSVAIYEFNVDTDYIAKGKTAFVEFAATRSGTFAYECGPTTFDCSARHADMRGAFVVTPP